MLTQVAAELAARNTLATQARMAKGEVYGASFAITARLRTFTYPLIDFGHNGRVARRYPGQENIVISETNKYAPAAGDIWQHSPRAASGEARVIPSRPDSSSPRAASTRRVTRRRTSSWRSRRRAKVLTNTPSRSAAAACASRSK